MGFLVGGVGVANDFGKRFGGLDMGMAAVGALAGQDPLATTPVLLRQDLDLLVRGDSRRFGAAQRLGERLLEYRPGSMGELYKMVDRERFMFSLDPVFDGLSVVAWTGWFGEKAARWNLPLIIPDGRQGQQNDKAIHFSANALRSYMTFKALNDGFFGENNAMQFVSGINKMIDGYIGRENFALVKEKIRAGHVPSLDLRVFGVKNELETNILERLFDLGLIFEIMTTPASGEEDPGEDANINKLGWEILFDRLLNGGLATDERIKRICSTSPDLSKYTGVLDGKVEFDLIADSLGTLYGYLLAKEVNKNRLAGRRHRVRLDEVQVPFDDFSRRFPEDIVNHQQRGDPYREYPFPKRINGFLLRGSAVGVV